MMHIAQLQSKHASSIMGMLMKYNGNKNSKTVLTKKDHYLDPKTTHLSAGH